MNQLLSVIHRTFPKFSCFVLLLLCSISLHAQDKKLDSLLTALKTAKQDTNQVRLLNKIGKAYEFVDQDLSKHYLFRSEKLADSLHFKEGKGQCSTYLGYVYEDLLNFDSAMYYYNLAFDLYQQLGDVTKSADELNVIGDAYRSKGDYSQALSYLQRAGKMYESVNSLEGVGGVNYSMGVLYQGLHQNANAMESYKKALEVYKKTNRRNEIGNALTAVGIIYNQQKDYKTARTYYFEAKKIYEEQHYDNGLSNLLTWIAITAYNEHKLDEALDYFTQSMALYEKINSVSGLIYAYNNIGLIYSDKKEYAKSIEWQKKSLELAEQSKGLEYIEYSHEMLAKTYSEMGDFKSAFEHQKLFMQYKDSVLNETSMKQINEMQTKYETEKKDKELLKKDSEILKQTTQRNYFLIGFTLMLFFSMLVFRSYRQKQKANTIIAAQKQEVEIQKELIEEKQKEIVDSITYAKRLQQAILPPESFIKHYLPENFILNKPKDIVAGDFYWMKVITKENSPEQILIAAADCTGHGVPGAMVSVVCSNALDRTVKEFGITEPGKILDKVRELVVETFEKSESEVKDGMDISLCLINPQTCEIEWAGANNPLWYMKDNELKEIKANKQPIGKTDTPLPFTTHHLQLNKGTCLYLFTDGYADQFGGDKGKKFKYKPFQQLLASASGKPMEEQKKLFDTTIEEWRGGLEQVDDILIIGIKL